MAISPCRSMATARPSCASATSPSTSFPTDPHESESLMRHLLPILALSLSTAAPLMAAADPYDQSGVPLEVDTSDPALTKIVLIAGRKSHGPGDNEFFAGCAILMDMLKQTPGVFPVMARDGWPKNEAILKGAKSIVLYMDGRGGHPVNGKLDVMKRIMAQGVGWFNIHYAVFHT